MNQDDMKRKMDEIKGEIKENVGEMTRNEELAEEGRQEKLANRKEPHQDDDLNEDVETQHSSVRKFNKIGDDA